MSDCIIRIDHETQWILSCFFDIRSYLIKNEHEQKETMALN